MLAALAAIASLRAGGTVNEALVLKTQTTRLQAEASDLWAYYQAKGIKLAVQQATAAPWQAVGKAAPPGLAATAERYAREQRDEVSREADELLHRHHGFANAVALFQVAIALGAVAALTRLRLVWAGSLVMGALGVLLFARAFMP
jgi:hypothetical protein